MRSVSVRVWVPSVGERTVRRKTQNGESHSSELLTVSLIIRSNKYPRIHHATRRSFLYYRLRFPIVTVSTEGRRKVKQSQISGQTSGVPGGLGCSTPPRNSEVPSKSCQTQTNLWKLLKIAEFRTPTPQFIQKKGSKILKLPRFAIVLH